MFSNLVTYYIHKQNPLPLYDALAYQYILAGNGFFIRAEARFFDALLPVASCIVRGLAPLRQYFQLKVPRIPAQPLSTILTDALRARRPSGDQAENGLNEVLYQFHHYGHTVQVKKPPQRASGVSVTAAGSSDPAVFCDLHSHGNMRAFWNRTDDADEQSARVFAIIGKLDTEPEIRLRVGLYGWLLATAAGYGRFHRLRPLQRFVQGDEIMSDNNGKGADSSIHNADYAGLTDEPEEPVTIKGFAVTYDRTFNLGNHEFLNAAVTILVKANVPQGEVIDLHHAKERVRRMARNNIRAQMLRAQDKEEVVFLGLQPPLDGRDDPVSVESVSVSLVQTVNLGNLNSITLGFTDWMDMQDVAYGPEAAHLCYHWWSPNISGLF